MWTSASANLPAIATERSQWLIGFFCLPWFEDVHRISVFEVVATRVDHRQLGLGRTVLREGMRRLLTLGATVACVGCVDGTPADYLYQSVGFADSDVERQCQKTF